uniref:Uncharacterized protein n=1 Tax=Pristionchus pacificus TaxID=54126 RepID=A0A2A6CS28_PRIPA|eukprot:PDM80867.1 hypothetical protein PRIPAC_35870 [Pristionchus pacificus]
MQQLRRFTRRTLQFISHLDRLPRRQPPRPQALPMTSSTAVTPPPAAAAATAAAVAAAPTSTTSVRHTEAA